ncbi:hypothetical protein MRX96_054660 [Rhipicephalus microplus]
MPDEQFGRHFRLSKATVLRLRDEVTDGLAGCALGGVAEVCAPRFFATGPFKSSVGGEETVAVTQPAVSICVRHVARVIANTGTRNKWLHIPRAVKDKSAVKKKFLWFGPLPGMIGCVDGGFAAAMSEQKAAFGAAKAVSLSTACSQVAVFPFSRANVFSQ